MEKSTWLNMHMAGRRYKWRSKRNDGKICEGVREDVQMRISKMTLKFGFEDMHGNEYHQ